MISRSSIIIKLLKSENACSVRNILSPQERIINSCGSVSDPNADKFKMFNILGTKASKIDVLLPMENIESWIECKLLRIIRVGSVDLIIGEAVAAYEQSDIA